jgi:hypothetical protein
MRLGTMRRPHLAHVLLLIAVGSAVLVGLDGLDPQPAKARRGYGKRGYGGYKRCGNACQVKRCRKGCNRAKRTCVYCVKQDLKPLKTACKGRSDAQACRGALKVQLKTALQTCRGATGTCGQCCRNDYSGSCTNSFSGTSGFGTYFRRVRSYGKVRRYKPECDGNTGAGAEGACRRTCESARAAALRACGKRGCDVAVIEASYQSCVAACGGGSPGGAFPRR